jgi:hypothetical protein
MTGFIAHLCSLLLQFTNHYVTHYTFSTPSSSTAVSRDSISSNSGKRQSQSQSYITTDDQSASLSWCLAPIWGLRPDFYYCQTFAGLLMRGALSDERTGLPFAIAAGPRQRSYSRIRVRWDSQPYFTVSDLRTPFSRLLRLAGLRWRYSTPPPHGIKFSRP